MIPTDPDRTYIAKVPSNIALLKYWGKSDTTHQWPANDSISMTLSSCHTLTEAKLLSREKTDTIYLNHVEVTESESGKRIRKHLDFLRSHFSEFEGSYLQINTQNSFPNDCGIASSASGFAALTTSALAALTQSADLGELDYNGITLGHISHLARMGSGSACRSLWGGYVQWRRGATHFEQRAFQLHHENHWLLHDLIVVLDSSKKAVSSSQGHLQAWRSPFFKPRLAGIEERKNQFLNALALKDFEFLGQLLESEAIEVHGVMATSKEPVYYLSEESFDFMVWLRDLRAHQKLKAFFTFDAGPNPHVLCEPETLQSFLYHLKIRYPNVKIIVDETGTGPHVYTT